MIQINCTKCQALLTLDDGFAGGTCRCRHCNAIQTVPRHLRDGNGNGMSAVGAKTQKLIYENQAQQGGPGSGSGIDELANIVASSGLSSGRLQKSSGRARVIPPTTNKNTVLLLSMAGAVIAALLGVIIVMAVRDKSTPQAVNNANGNNKPGPTPSNVVVPPSNSTNSNVVTPAQPPVSKGPGFLGVPLNYKTVIYVIDNGSGAATNASAIKSATLNSIASLGPERYFQVILWENTGPLVMHPSAGTAKATPQNIELARKAIWDAPSFSQSKAEPAIRRAVESKPDAICLLAAKLSFQGDFSAGVIKALGNSKAKVHTFAIGSTEISAEMKEVSGKMGGQHKDVTVSELNAAAR